MVEIETEIFKPVNRELMKHSKICLLVLFVFSSALYAQDTIPDETSTVYPRKNSFYFEVLGNAAVWSLNYDRILPIKNKFAMLLRVGGNEYHADDSDDLSFNILGAAGILYGTKLHFFESNIGYTYFTASPDRLTVLSAGYRFMGKKGLVIRASPMYIFNTEKVDSFGNGVWFGFSAGYAL